jgi:hypothetical protein
MNKNTVSVAPPQGQTQVVTYPAPAGTEPSPDYTVSVDGNPVFVYTARVSAMPVNQVWPGYQRPLDQTEIASFAYFDCSAPVTVEVVSSWDVSSVEIRPQSYGIVPSVHGNTISFCLSKPCQVVVEVNGWHHALHLFANPIEQDVPAPHDPHVHYFGPGVHHPGIVEMQAGETVYIAGGAIVHGVIQAKGVSDIKILGRGILDSSTVKRFDAGPTIALLECTRAEVRGIILRDPHVWTVVPAKCRDVTLSNIKLIGLWRYNADGIDLVNSVQVLIEDCFVRSFDDSIVLKGFNRWHDHSTGGWPVKDVTVRNCVLWNDWGRALEIGAETQADEIRDVTFENCDIIHWVHIAMDVQNGDRAAVSNVRFKDIRVEDPIVENARIADRAIDASHLGLLIVLVICETNYSKDSERGTIRDIHFGDISVTGSAFPRSRFIGHDDTHLVENITVKNLLLHGQHITTAEQAQFSINPYAKEIHIE